MRKLDISTALLQPQDRLGRFDRDPRLYGSILNNLGWIRPRNTWTQEIIKKNGRLVPGGEWKA